VLDRTMAAGGKILNTNPGAECLFKTSHPIQSLT